MASITLPTERIFDWASFHRVSVEVFGFPDFYGQNMNAWIDCLTYLDDGMSAFQLLEGEQLTIIVEGFADFYRRVPEVCADFLSAVAFINVRVTESGGQPRLMLQLT